MELKTSRNKIGVSPEEEEEKQQGEVLPEKEEAPTEPVYPSERPLESDDTDAFMATLQDATLLNPLAIDVSGFYDLTTSMDGNVKSDEEGRLFVEKPVGGRAYIDEISIEKLWID